MTRFEIHKIKSRFSPFLNTIQYRVSIDHLVGRFALLRKPVLDETSWLFSREANVWLTEHCSGLWGIYQENYLVFGLGVGFNSVLSVTDCLEACRPFLGFQYRDDALMFRLSF